MLTIRANALVYQALIAVNQLDRIVQHRSLRLCRHHTQEFENAHPTVAEFLDSRAKLGARARSPTVCRGAKPGTVTGNDIVDLHLLVVGEFEPEDPPSKETRAALEPDPNVHPVGFQSDVVPYLEALDVLAHPSCREGLPTSPLEASALALPVVATRIPGCADAIEDGVTGILILARGAAALAGALGRLLKDSELRRRMGEAGPNVATRRYHPITAWQAVDRLYKELVLARRSTSAGHSEYDRKTLRLSQLPVAIKMGGRPYSLDPAFRIDVWRHR
jgi:hypothetical protein